MALYSSLAVATVTPRLPSVDDLFTSAAQRIGVARELLMALAAHESTMAASALGAANANGTRDYGIMQVNEQTYRDRHAGEVVDPEDLQDPAVGIPEGAAIFAEKLQQAGGNMLWAISGYNRGVNSRYRVNAASPWQPLTQGKLADGSFPNQAYVDDIVAWVRYFRAAAGKPTDVTADNLTTAGFGTSPFAVLLLVGAVVGAWLLRGRGSWTF